MNQSNTLTFGITPKKVLTVLFVPHSVRLVVSWMISTLSSLAVSTPQQYGLSASSSFSNRTFDPAISPVRSSFGMSTIICVSVHVRTIPSVPNSVRERKKNMAGEDDDNISDNRAWISKLSVSPFTCQQGYNCLPFAIFFKIVMCPNLWLGV